MAIRSWRGKYYLYSVSVWVPGDPAVDTNLTTDPYSIDIALNGTKSRITDLDSDETKPSGWDDDRLASAAQRQRHEHLRASHPRLQHQRHHRARRAPRHVRSLRPTRTPTA